jgi:UDP-N-acetylmuramoylalanine--D-glutamate ligase
LVVGLGRSGIAAAAVLDRLGCRVRVYDRNPAAPAGLPRRARAFLGAAQPPQEAFAGVDLLVLSPGVPPAPIHAALARDAVSAAVHGELSLGLALQGVAGIPVADRTVLVTGTNGKSTVTALTGALLAAAGLEPFVGGNLGDPLCERWVAVLEGTAPPPRSLVLECSSFQLETYDAAATDVAMVLNVTPDHLDRHGTVQAYARTKARIFRGLRTDGLALVHDGDPWSDEVLADVPASLVRRVGREVVLAGDELQLLAGERLPRAALPLPGRHNVHNALFALAAARHVGASLAACEAGLRGFRALPHRMQLVRELDGVAWYDDSKATNVAAVLAGLAGFERPFVLLAGGRAKGDDPRDLAPALRASGRAMVVFGEAGPAFAAAAAGIVPVQRAATLPEAVALARSLARPGDAVLLSPGCASYDMFRDYGERGDVFAAAVQALGGAAPGC